MPRLRKADPVARKIGQRVKSLLDQQAKTQEKLAYENGISKATLSDMVKGLARPSVLTLQRIADGLGVELLDLFVDPASSARHRLIDLTRHASPAVLAAMLAAGASSSSGRARKP